MSGQQNCCPERRQPFAIFSDDPTWSGGMQMIHFADDDDDDDDDDDGDGDVADALRAMTRMLR